MTNAIQRARDGDRQAFADAVLPLEGRLYNLARAQLRNSADCADAMQEALLRAWKRLPSLRDGAAFEPWLFRILIHECGRIRSRLSAHPTVPLDDSYTAPTPADTLRMALDMLPEGQRLLICLHHMLGYSIEEIAHMLRIPQGTVKSRLGRARQALRGHLEDKYEQA